jgi:hypothetical protein
VCGRGTAARPRAWTLTQCTTPTMRSWRPPKLTWPPEVGQPPGTGRNVDSASAQLVKSLRMGLLGRPDTTTSHVRLGTTPIMRRRRSTKQASEKVGGSCRCEETSSRRRKQGRTRRQLKREIRLICAGTWSRRLDVRVARSVFAAAPNRQFADRAARVTTCLPASTWDVVGADLPRISKVPQAARSSSKSARWYLS